MAVPLRFGTEFSVSTQNTNTQTSSSTTRLADGRLVVVWTDAGANAGDVKYQILSPNGAPLGLERTANVTNGGLQGAPKVAALDDGSFVIVWEDMDNSRDPAGNIMFRRFDTNGTPLDLTDVTATAMTAGYQQDPAVVAKPGGGFVIGWNEGNTSVSGLGSSTAAMIREFSASGTPAGSAIRMSGDFGGDFGPQLAFAGTTLLAVWDDDGGPASGANGEDGLYTRALPSPLPGSNFSDGGTRVDTGAFRESSRNPDIAHDLGLGRLIVWDDVTTGSVGRDVYIDIDGAGPVRVNTTTANDQSNAQIVALALGGFAVVWQDAGGTAGDIRARVYDRFGVATSADFLVTSAGPATANSQSLPDVVALLDGRFMVTWTDNFAGGIEGMIFDPRTGGVSLTAPGLAGVWLRGTDFAAGDSLVGAVGNDSLDGGGGQDTVYGGGGDDNLFGGEGNDTLAGSDGLDVAYGGNGDDLFLAYDPDDVSYGGNGNDTFELSPFIFFGIPYHPGNFDAGVGPNGGSDDRFIASVVLSIDIDLAAGVYTYLGETRDLLFVEHASAGAEADRLTGNAANNILEADTGNDTILGGGGQDSLYGEVGSDTLEGGTGNDALFGGLGSDALSGSAGNDVLNGGAGNDTLLGGAGNDTYVVDSTGDRVFETTTAASLINAGGIDTVQSAISFNLNATPSVRFVETLLLTGTALLNGTGNALANRLIGNAGNNTLDGGAGTDNLAGGAGNDTLNGGSGNDVLTGGIGRDSFVFATPLLSTNIDLITDFSVADDTIRIENAVFTGLAAGNLTTAAFARNLSGLATDAADRILFETDTGRLYFDRDGTGATVRVHFATLAVNLTLTHADFFVI